MKNHLFFKNLFYSFVSKIRFKNRDIGKMWIVIIAISLTTSMQAQEFCATTKIQDKLEKSNPAIKKARLDADAKLLALGARNYIQSKRKSENTIYEIPVVVHIIHPTGATIGTKYNNSNAEIENWIEEANKIFETTYGNGYFPNGTGNDKGTTIPIKLVLAKRDKSCNATNGIVRYDGGSITNYNTLGLNSDDDNAIAKVRTIAPHWPESSYYNIYVISKFDNNDNSGGLGGWAGYPTNPDSSYDTFMRSFVVTDPGNNTFVHEMGHALGLMHTFGSANDQGGACPASTDNCELDDDLVCDTERGMSLLNTYPNPTNSDINWCTSSNYQGVQYNIMNYTSEPRKFTPGQRDRALAQFLLSRENLTTSNGGLAPNPSEGQAPIASHCKPSSLENNVNLNAGPVLVKINSINNKTTGQASFNGSQFYIDYTTQNCLNKAFYTDLEISEQQSITVKVRNNNKQDIRVWIDYNSNGVFDNGELVAFVNKYNGNSDTDEDTWTAQFTAPSNTILNVPLRMRVIADLAPSGEISMTNACANLFYGQAEDYTVTFINTSTAVVYIADTGLKAYLVGRADINTNNDNEIQASEALAFTGIIEYVNKGLTDATGVEAFVNITKLFLYNNNLTTLNVTKNTALTHLDLGKNQLVNLDVSKNTSLVDLFCFENQLTALNVTQNTKLKNLACYTNQIASLDVSKNIELLDFRCFENQLTSLDVTKNTLLTSLDVGSNQLTVFDVSKNIALTGLRCNNNKLTSFDISKNTVLSGLICIQNQLTSLNLKNGNNAILTTLWTQNNPSLTCIQVDNVANANSYTTAGNWQKDATAIYNTNCDPIVNIPDANFKSYLLSVSSINTNGDNEIQVSEATAFTGTIDCSNRNIASLVGIEAFVKLTNLFCSGNQLTSLDVSKNTALDRLNCFNNQITALDVSKNVALTFLSSTTNPIKTLNVSKNTLLTILYCGNNQLTALDISKNTALKELSCHINQLTSLDISRNILLNEVYAYNNRLTSVDASKNTNLTIFSAHTNNLTALNIKNGQNSKITNFEVRLNPNLTCIQVDNVTSASSYSNWFKDATASYNINCGETLGLSENKSSYLTVYPNPVKDILNFSEQVSDIKITDLSGRTIKQISASTNGINVSNLSKGTYIVTATTKAGNTITKKIIKE